MTERHLIVVDIETTGLRALQDVPVEVAALNVTTGEKLEFIPNVTREQLANAQYDALAVNRYFERRLFAKMLNLDSTNEAYERLAKMLKGNTFAGSNPAFDADILRSVLINQVGISPQWHHRLADISAITAGLFGIMPTEMPGLADCCLKFGFQAEEVYESHTAMGDVLATAECFRRYTTGRYPKPVVEF